MHNEVNTVETEENSLGSWNPQQTLFSLSLDDVRFSRGFLQFDGRLLFDGLMEEWRPLFERLGAVVELSRVEPGFFFPEGLDVLTPIEVMGELGVIGIDEAGRSRLIEAIAPASSPESGAVVYEYLERRFLTSLSKRWAGDTPLICYACRPDSLELVEIGGAITVELLVNGEPVTFSIGLGSRAVELIDMEWRQKLISGGGQIDDEVVNEFSIELTQLSLTHEALVEAFREGNVIDPDLELSEQVLVLKNGEPWARATLMQFNGRFAAQIGDFSPEPFIETPDSARVLVTLAVTELDVAGERELAQPGALLLTREEVAPFVSLFISGEEVAAAQITTENNRFLLTVLPRP